MIIAKIENTYDFMNKNPTQTLILHHPRRTEKEQTKDNRRRCSR